MAAESGSELRRPRTRQCERCGRRERWSSDVGGWRVAADRGGAETGEAHCIHEWDINGTFYPFERD